MVVRNRLRHSWRVAVVSQLAESAFHDVSKLFGFTNGVEVEGAFDDVERVHPGNSLFPVTHVRRLPSNVSHSKFECFFLTLSPLSEIKLTHAHSHFAATQSFSVTSGLVGREIHAASCEGQETHDFMFALRQ